MSEKEKVLKEIYIYYDKTLKTLKTSTWPDGPFHFYHWTPGLLTVEHFDESFSPAPLSVSSLSPLAAAWGPNSGPSAAVGALTLTWGHHAARFPASTYFSDLWNTKNTKKRLNSKKINKSKSKLWKMVNSCQKKNILICLLKLNWQQFWECIHWWSNFWIKNVKLPLYKWFFSPNSTAQSFTQNNIWLLTRHIPWLKMWKKSQNKIFNIPNIFLCQYVQ